MSLEATAGPSHALAVTCEPWTGMVEMAPVTELVAAAHGTSSPAGQAAVDSLIEAVARRRPDLAVAGSFVDVQEPSVEASLSVLPGRSRIVPLLLSAGYHVHVDLARAAAGKPGTTVSGALGPDNRLVRVLVRRLEAAGLEAQDEVILGCAGSSDARAVADCEAMAARLGTLLGRSVSAGYISAVQPNLKASVAAQRAHIEAACPGADEVPPARVIVASYLLAPGHFASLAAECGADVVTDPLLIPGQEPDPDLVDLVLDRFTG